MEIPALLLALDDVGRQILPRRVRHIRRERRPADRHRIGHERIEEPPFLRALPDPLVVVAKLAELLAGLDAELNASVPQHLAGLALVNLCIHIERREQRIEGRRGGVHQERLVEALVLDVTPLAAEMFVLLVNLRGLRETGALLVDRLRGEESGHLRSERLQPHRAVVFEERMECVVANPRLVPEHVVAQVPDLLEHLADVVDRAVVGRQLDARQAERALRFGALRIRHEGVRADLLAEPPFVPGVPVDGANHPERIAGGRQEDRNSTCLHERALMQRLVVVAIEEYQIASPQHGIGDHLVGRARAVQHEIRLVGAEHMRRMLLRPRRRAFMNEQIAEVDVGVAQVVAEDALPEMLEEQLAGWGFPVELTALMARAGEGDVGLGIVGHEPAKERRQQTHPVVDDARHYLLGVETRRLLPEVDVALDLVR